MNADTPQELDIFKAAHDGTFNACVGENGIHDLRTYAEGYIESSILLLEAIVEKRLLGQRDTLVHPILYSARHAIELSIKHVLFELNKCDVKIEPRQTHGHSLSKLWSAFKLASRCDSRLVELYEEINPIVKHLDGVDPDAQGFRYPNDNNNEKTLQGKMIVDLLSTYKMVKVLQVHLKSLVNVVDVIVEERLLGSFTQDLNRPELKVLSENLSEAFSEDSKEKFLAIKKKWKNESLLSSAGFERALAFIKKHREFAGNIGQESELLAISRELLDQVVQFKLSDIELDFKNKDLPIVERAKQRPISWDAFEALKAQLTAENVAELESLYYLTSLGQYSETYASLYEQYLGNLNFQDEARRKRECMEAFIGVFDKVSFLDYLVTSLKQVGLVSLSEKYAELNDSVKVKYDYL
jgi:hypothetical protein